MVVRLGFASVVKTRKQAGCLCTVLLFVDAKRFFTIFIEIPDFFSNKELKKRMPKTMCVSCVRRLKQQHFLYNMEPF